MNYLVKDGNKSPKTAHSPGENHGLFNQGATCYLNSVLQVLFMTEGFHAAVKKHTSEYPDTECVDRHLTDLFEDLKENTAHTKMITEKLGISRVDVQHDAAEYFQKILSLTSQTASEIFHGLLTHKTVCSTCGEETESDVGFLHLPLALADSYYFKYFSVLNGLENYFRVSHFSGENRIYCDKCDAKSDATTECLIKHLPEALMLQLNRFKFDYNSMTTVKNHCTVRIPFTLQTPETQTYELYAFVDHFGDLTGGHYTATIRVDEMWREFDDSNVTLPDPHLCQMDSFTSCNAYLLFYRKINECPADICSQDSVSTGGGFGGVESEFQPVCDVEDQGVGRVSGIKSVCSDGQGHQEMMDSNGKVDKEGINEQNESVLLGETMMIGEMKLSITSVQKHGGDISCEELEQQVEVRGDVQLVKDQISS
ncbi:ubiquitin carboxyl-terminal hydrolase 12-like isoform X2 [Antennarius striatus]|uniref:ubiquitin carboxyl-terminal hydrolase 12-like isoform X2 n=1 Tax=Antennarius striatus TaxID=241820 RepID=UPI0035B31277